MHLVCDGHNRIGTKQFKKKHMPNQPDTHSTRMSCVQHLWLIIKLLSIKNDRNDMISGETMGSSYIKEMTNQMTCFNECATFPKASMCRTDLLHRSRQNNTSAQRHTMAQPLRHDRRLIRNINKPNQMKGTSEKNMNK